MLDVDEYVHLALDASSRREHHACLTYLNLALQLQPENATAIYLVAVQHAELGLQERAISGMQTALSIEPQLEIARFQLGLLLLERNRPAEAKKQFAALGGSADPGLQIYSEAMIALVDNDLAAARQKLAVGLSRHSANPALSAVMQRLFDHLAKNSEAEPGQPDSQDNRVVLGAYGQTSS